MLGFLCLGQMLGLDGREMKRFCGRAVISR